VIANEVRVNEYEVDRRRLQPHHRQAPAAASDLRLIMAISKTVTDLERIGDEAEKIAPCQADPRARARDLHRFATVRHAADIALSMLRQALDAFARLDAADAASIIRQEVAIDTEFRSILRQLITFMMEDPRTISTALEIVWIAKAIERIGDHAKNIAEESSISSREPMFATPQSRSSSARRSADGHGVEREQKRAVMGGAILVVEDERRSRS